MLGDELASRRVDVKKLLTLVLGPKALLVARGSTRRPRRRERIEPVCSEIDHWLREEMPDVTDAFLV